MGVTNLENNQNHAHVKHIAEFAIDIVNEASKVMIDLEDSSRGFVSLRVGFHSGSVVSNVIGTLNKRYVITDHIRFLAPSNIATTLATPFYKDTACLVIQVCFTMMIFSNPAGRALIILFVSLL